MTSWHGAMRLAGAVLLSGWLAACGGGGGDTQTYYVDFNYTPPQTPLRVFVAVSPTLTGLEGRTPSCAVAQGSLPPGLSINASTCAVSGTATAAGTFSAVIRLTSQGVSGSVDAVFNMTIVDPTPSLAKSVGTGSGADVTVFLGAPMTPVTLATVLPFDRQPSDVVSFVQTGGTVPPGLTLDLSDASLRGTPTAFGPAEFNVAATLVRAGITYTTPPVTIAVNVTLSGLSIAYSSCIASQGTPLTCAPSSNSYVPLPGSSLVFSAMGLPTGMSIDPSTGVISGIASTGGSVQVTARNELPGGAVLTATANAFLIVAGSVPQYDMPPYSNLGLASEPHPDSLGGVVVGLTSGVQFTINLNSISAPVPGDVYSFLLEPYDAGTPLPVWVFIDATSGQITGVAPGGTTYAAWSVRLTTLRNGQSYVATQKWAATIN